MYGSFRGVTNEYPLRYGHASASDLVNSRWYHFGGRAVIGEEYLADVWTYDWDDTFWR
jgi:hypothetical protein